MLLGIQENQEVRDPQEVLENQELQSCPVYPMDQGSPQYLQQENILHCISFIFHLLTLLLFFLSLYIKTCQISCILFILMLGESRF